MVKRCRFCGEKIQADASRCEHCGKTLKKQQETDREGAGLTNLDSWKNKSVPSWVMYLVLAITALCVILMVMEGCERMTGEM